MEKRDFKKINKSETRPDAPVPSDKEVVFGIRAVIETVRAGKEVDKILVDRELNLKTLGELYQETKGLNIPIQKVPAEKLNRITRKNHQGVICFISAINYASLENVIDKVFKQGKMPLILLLDRITDVRNFGAIARSAECAGVDAIVIPAKGAAQINADAIKTSAGALGFIPVCREENFKSTIEFLQYNGIRVVACTEKAEGLLYETDLTGPTAIIMGSEEDGISTDCIRKADVLAKIPMAGHIGSLNVSVAAGVILYEAIRQRLKV
jgi:23S rRNA (guanosine2251-2'-O)-methyltransferase